MIEFAGDVVPLDGHDGRSGASVGRARLADGTPVVVKRSRPADDFTTAVDGVGDRELRLWQAGVLDRLPSPLGHSILDAHWDDDAVVTVMRDLGTDVLSWDRTLSPEEVRRIFAAVAAMHMAFDGARVDGLCPLEARLTAFAPERLAALGGDADSLPALVLKGWDRFSALVPDEVATAVFAALAAPDRLVQALGRSPMTMLHGDLWLVNAALPNDEVVLLDWALATWGPGVLDFVIFASGCFSHVAMSREALVDEIRRATAPYCDGETLRTALFCGLTEMGWNKALDAVDHDDPTQREVARAELEWWVDRARESLA